MTGDDWLRLAAIGMCVALLIPAAASLRWGSPSRILFFAVFWAAILGACYLAWQVVRGDGCSPPNYIPTVVTRLAPDCPMPSQYRPGGS